MVESAPLSMVVLEYLRLLVSWPVVSGAIAMGVLVLYHGQFRRILAQVAMFRVGGVELSLQQQSVGEVTTIDRIPKLPEPDSITEQEVSHPDPSGHDHTVELLKAEQKIATIWHFRFLNYFLVQNTQMILNWFYTSTDPITKDFYNANFSALDTNERVAVLEALISNGLVEDGQHLMKISGKGVEYVTWPGRTLMGYTLPPGGTPSIALPAQAKDPR